MTELEERMIEAHDPETEGFVIDSPEKASWALRVIGKADRELRDSIRVAQTEAWEISQYEKEVRERHQKAVENLQGMLSVYHQTVLADDPSAKTLRFPTGELWARKKPDQWNYEDEEAFTDWANAFAPSLIRKTISPDKTEAKKALKVLEDGTVVSSDGETVPGLFVEKGSVNLTARAKVDD